MSKLLIPVSWPLLPKPTALLPYLEEIQQNRSYSNFGPLSKRFERKLASRWQISAEGVSSVANATIALTTALLARPAINSKQNLVLMPSWTFVATAHAVIAAGLTPLFLDVNQNGELRGEIVVEAVKQYEDQVAAIIPVSPFGAPLNWTFWENLQEETGVSIIIDAAAAFDSIIPTKCISIVSLHATKVLGIGEGGLAISVDTQWIDRIRCRVNFGFQHTRQAQVPAYNAKLSEYHAAVGLAGLKEWPQTRARWQKTAEHYQQALSCDSQIQWPQGFGTKWLSSTLNIQLLSGTADELSTLLRHNNIDSRNWWDNGCHHQPAYSKYPHTSLPQTELLAAHTLGIPFFQDMTQDQIHAVRSVITNYIHSQKKH